MFDPQDAINPATEQDIQLLEQQWALRLDYLRSQVRKCEAEGKARADQIYARLGKSGSIAEYQRAMNELMNPTSQLSEECGKARSLYRACDGLLDRLRCAEVRHGRAIKQARQKLEDRKKLDRWREAEEGKQRAAESGRTARTSEWKAQEAILQDSLDRLKEAFNPAAGLGGTDMTPPLLDSPSVQVALGTDAISVSATLFKIITGRYRVVDALSDVLSGGARTAFAAHGVNLERTMDSLGQAIEGVGGSSGARSSGPAIPSKAKEAARSRGSVASFDEVLRTVEAADPGAAKEIRDQGPAAMEVMRQHWSEIGPVLAQHVEALAGVKAGAPQVEEPGTAGLDAEPLPPRLERYFEGGTTGRAGAPSASTVATGPGLAADVRMTFLPGEKLVKVVVKGMACAVLDLEIAADRPGMPPQRRRIRAESRALPLSEFGMTVWDQSRIRILACSRCAAPRPEWLD